MEKRTGTTLGTHAGLWTCMCLYGSNPSSLTIYGGVLFFSANAFGNHWYRIWNSAVQKLTVQKLELRNVELVPSYKNFLISRGAFVGGYYVFAGYTPGNGQELWKTDGTQMELPLSRFESGPGKHHFSQRDKHYNPFTTVNGKAYFTADKWIRLRFGALAKRRDCQQGRN